MRVVLFGRDGKVGSVLGPRLVEAGHEVTGVEVGEEPELAGHDAAVDFTAPARCWRTCAVPSRPACPA